jgi:anaerobic magnesium-protoporphyrin IX monomethyl ester cyclase
MQPRKMLFIRPPSTEMGETAKTQNVHQRTIPYGILSIMTYVNRYKTRDISLSILDMNVDGQDVGDVIKEIMPDVVGISAQYNHVYPWIERIGKIVRSVDRDILVLAGGACIMAYYDQVLSDCPSVDALCYAEGEIPVLDLLESPDMVEVLSTHDSFTLRGSGKPKATYVDTLDDIPLVDFSLIDLSKYKTKYDVFNPSPDPNDLFLPITTTRGCPFNCYFCTVGGLKGKKMRKMSAKRVIEDITTMKEKYGMTSLGIEDDQFTMDGERAKQIFKGLAPLGISVDCMCGMMVCYIDDELIPLMKPAGIKIVTLPVESGSQYVLDNIIRKPVKLDTIPDLVRKLKKEGLLVHANIILGFPGEKKDHWDETREFLFSSGIDRFNIFCATPIRGSKLYADCIEKGYIKSGDLNADGYIVSSITTPDFTAAEVTKAVYDMNIDLNFMRNTRMREGDYETAAAYFSHVARKYPGHAVAHLCLAKALFKLPEWREYANRSI